MPIRGFLVLCVVAAWAIAAPAASATTVPPGFVDEGVATGIPEPTALAFTPDGRLLATSKQGRVYVVSPNGSGATTVAYDIGPVLCSNDERGLHGLAVDPNFAANGHVYLFYTRKRSNCGTSALLGAANRVSRFTMSGNTVIPGSELVLIDGIASPGNIHLAGDLEFGKDGYLYVTSGDGNCHYSSGLCGNANTAAREVNNLHGKLLRIKRDGTIPPDNPYSGGARCNTGPTGSGRYCAEIYAIGLRNPFRMIHDPNAAGTRFFLNDVGALKWEEVNLGKKGADYGWNQREGHCLTDSYTNCPPPSGGMTDPMYDYPHTSGCTSIVGGAIIPSGLWPAPYDAAHLFSDYVCGKIMRLVPKAGGGYETVDFATDMADYSAIHVEWGPVPGGDQALYYNSFGAGGVIRRIRHVGAVNRPPTAALAADPTVGQLPLTVHFDGAGSSDPDGDPITYEWDFGDGTPVQETSSPTIDHTYLVSGDFTATLRSKDDEGLASQPAGVTISAGNTAPSVAITAPDPGHRFKVGEQVTLRAEAIDPEDGALPGSAISWEIKKWHGAGTPTAHTHPFLSATTGSQVTISAPPPEDVASTTNSHLEVAVTAVDSRGVTADTTRDLMPKYVWVTFGSSPNGVEFTVNGVRLKTSTWFVSWPGYNLFVDAPAKSQNLWFNHWEDGPTSRQRNIVTPDGDSTWKMYYNVVPPT